MDKLNFLNRISIQLNVNAVADSITAYILPLPSFLVLVMSNFAAKMTIAIGSPIGGGEKIAHPTPDQIDQLHTQYLQAMKGLFDKYKEEAGYANTPIHFTVVNK
jgi:hypothetical protein